MSSFDLVLNLINTDNPSQYPLSPEIVTFGNVVALTGQSKNTQVTVTAMPNTSYYGSVDVMYNRIDLGELGNDIGILSETPFTAEIITEQINSSLGIDLDPDEIMAVGIVDMDVGDIDVISITADSDSLAWIGSNINVQLLFGLPTNTNVLHELMNVTLPSSGYF